MPEGGGLRGRFKNGGRGCRPVMRIVPLIVIPRIMNKPTKRCAAKNLVLSERRQKVNKLLSFLGTGFLLLVTSLSTLAILFMLFFIARDAIPFFKLQGFVEFFTSTRWYPSADLPEFGALAIFAGSGLVTLGAAVVAVPLGVAPEILLMDEPTSALDPRATAKIEDLIGELRGEYTIIIVTHNMQQAARVSDYTAFMYEGELVEFGQTKQVFTNPAKKQTEDYITGRFG